MILHLSFLEKRLSFLEKRLRFLEFNPREWECGGGEGSLLSKEWGFGCNAGGIGG